MEAQTVRPGHTRRNVSPGQAPADVQQNVRMTNRQKRQLDVMAGALGISQAEFIRKMLDEHYTVMFSKVSESVQR